MKLEMLFLFELWIKSGGFICNESLVGTACFGNGRSNVKWLLFLWIYSEVLGVLGEKQTPFNVEQVETSSFIQKVENFLTLSSMFSLCRF